MPLGRSNASNYFFTALIFICLSFFSTHTYSNEVGLKSESILKESFWNIGNHTYESFTGWNALFHITAIGSTSILVNSGADKNVQNWSAGHDQDVSLLWSEPALLGGMIAPWGLPLGLMYWSKNSKWQMAGAAALQSFTIAITVNTFLKGITNRRGTEESIKSSFDESKDFNFGFFKQFPFDGWPSGHMMTNMAVMTTIATYFADTSWVQYASYGWATYIFAAVSFGHSGGIHWISDVVAGALMGWTIGRTVGRGFAKKHDDKKEAASNYQFIPIVNKDVVGLLFSMSF